MKLATVGTSKICREFVSACQNVGTDVLICFSRDHDTAQSFASEFGIPQGVTTFEQITLSGADTVYIATPNSLHASQSEYMLNNGLNVICEKPITSDFADYKRLKETADDHSLIYCEAIMSLYSPGLKALRDALPLIGTIRSVHLDYCQRSSRFDALCRGETPNIFSPSLHGGALNDLGVYCVYAAVELFGAPTEVFGARGYCHSGSDLYGCAVLGYDDKQVQISYNKSVDSPLGGLIIGDHGSISIASLSQMKGIILRLNDGCERVVYSSDDDKVRIMEYEVDAFNAFVSQGVDSPVYAESSRICVQVGEIMQRLREQR